MILLWPPQLRLATIDFIDIGVLPLLQKNPSKKLPVDACLSISKEALIILFFFPFLFLCFFHLFEPR